MGTKRRTLMQDRDLCREKIRGLYLEGTEPKVISNREGIDLGLVMKVIQDSKRDPVYMTKLQSVQTIKSTFVDDQKSEGKENEVKEVTVKRRKTLTEDEKLEMACDYETGNFTYDEIAKKYDIAMSTASRICNSLVSEEKRKEISRERHMATLKKARSKRKNNRKHDNGGRPKNVSAAKTTEEPTLEEVNFDRVFINVGLIDNRHPMPVQKFIFENIDRSNIGNFDWQEEVVNKFIDDNIKLDENGIPKFGLQVFVTGLQPALGTLFKVCLKRQINLTLKHYNPDKDNYDPQIILSDFKTSNPIPSSLWGQSFSNKRIYTYGIKLDEIDNLDSFYGINVVSRNKRTNDITDKFIIFISTQENMYKMFIQKSQELSSDKEFKHELYLNKLCKVNSEWKMNLIQKSYTC